MKLEDLGYNTFFESNRSVLGLDGYAVARVIAEYKEAYRVKNITNEYLAKISGRQMFNAVSREDYPCVGDWVAITERNTEEAVIHKLLPRQTILRRKYTNKSGAQVIGANIDVSFIIESVDKDYNLNRFERYFTMVNEGHIKPAIVLNKIDLITEAELNLKMSQLKTRFADINVIPISAITNQGLGGLMAYIERGKTYCFLGSSGVGKSSLINKLLGTDNIKTNTINLITGGGKHTTASRKMYFLSNGGMVIDNPGMKEIGMTDATAGIGNAFEEISALSEKCKYTDCSHTNETGCAVLEALKSGGLDGDKYSNYARLRKEAKEYKMTELEKGRSGHKFGKTVRESQQKQKSK